MMEKLDIILQLLEKEILTDSEKKELEMFAGSEPEMNSFIETYKKIDKSLNSAGHLPVDLISTYILYEIGDEPDNKLIPLIRDRIKAHIEECLLCRDEYNTLSENYIEIKEHVNKSIVRESKSVNVEPKKLSIMAFLNRSAIKYAFASLLILIVGYFGLFIISSAITPDYRNDIFAGQADDFYKTRGRTSVLFQQGLNAIEQGNYEEAIRFLTDDIHEHPNERSIFYSYYIIGLTYLKASESDFIGLFKSYEEEKVNLAIKYLEESVDKNNSGDYENLKLDTYYYLGRAYLVNDVKEQAKQNFQKVIDGKGRFFNEASNWIKLMEKN